MVLLYRFICCCSSWNLEWIGKLITGKVLLCCSEFQINLELKWSCLTPGCCRKDLFWESIQRRDFTRLPEGGAWTLSFQLFVSFICEGKTWSVGLIHVDRYNEKTQASKCVAIYGSSIFTRKNCHCHGVFTQVMTELSFWGVITQWYWFASSLSKWPRLPRAAVWCSVKI